MKRIVAVALCAVAVAGCQRGDGPPPPGLTPAPAAQVEQGRREKDTQFRAAPDSPIPSAARPSFTGLAYYPFDPAAQLRVKLHRYGAPKAIVIPESKGSRRPATRVGYVEFPWQGKPARLFVYHLDDLPPGDLFLPFRDATNGTETYGAGRYLDLASARDDWYVLDFNLAYNPYCAYGPDYECPRVPDENRLPFGVRAGERGWAGH